MVILTKLHKSFWVVTRALQSLHSQSLALKHKQDKRYTVIIDLLSLWSNTEKLGSGPGVRCERTKYLVITTTPPVNLQG